jgi:hypothetical protein
MLLTVLPPSLVFDSESVAAQFQDSRVVLSSNCDDLWEWNPVVGVD